MIRNTSDYLTAALGKTGRRPYTVAITSYALALLGNTADLKQHLLGAAAGIGLVHTEHQCYLFILNAIVSPVFLQSEGLYSMESSRIHGTKF